LRPFGTDLVAGAGKSRPSARLDEAFLALVMLGSALAFSAVFTGPWGSLKSAAFTIGSSSWLLYALGFLALNLVMMPASFALAVWVSHEWAVQKSASRIQARQNGSGSKVQLRRAVADQSQVLLPLGLFAWIAFTISFAFPKFNYVLSVLSDPLGWGWNLFGTANTTWAPDVSGFSPILQVGLLLIGLVWSASVAHRLAKSGHQPEFRQILPVLAFCLLFTLAMLWLLVG
jgi:hypothetical protein